MGGIPGWGAASSSPNPTVHFVLTNPGQLGTYQAVIKLRSGDQKITATVTVSVTFTSQNPSPPPPPPGGGPPSSAGLTFGVNLNAVNSLTWNKLNFTRLNGVIVSLGRNSAAWQGAVAIRVTGATFELDSNSHDPIGLLDQNEHGALNFGAGGGTVDITVTFKAAPVGYTDFSPPLTTQRLFHMHD